MRKFIGSRHKSKAKDIEHLVLVYNHEKAYLLEVKETHKADIPKIRDKDLQEKIIQKLEEYEKQPDIIETFKTLNTDLATLNPKLQQKLLLEAKDCGIRDATERTMTQIQDLIEGKIKEQLTLI